CTQYIEIEEVRYYGINEGIGERRVVVEEGRGGRGDGGGDRDGGGGIGVRGYSVGVAVEGCRSIDVESRGVLDNYEG
ncbi:unnamed protein product, partial [Nippostrongylus brasiliensis]|uniref:Polyprotein n=1 Tax=Nippostrongylus brasiliensis TaxID=27835 RepID=A0A0N4XR84_NIPBR